MKPGDMIIASHIQQIISNKAWTMDTKLDYSSGKKEYFVFIFLGSEPKDGSDNLDPIKRLNELGWNLNEEKE